MRLRTTERLRSPHCERVAWTSGERSLEGDVRASYAG
jgi:hypothetical protein